MSNPSAYDYNTVDRSEMPPLSEDVRYPAPPLRKEEAWRTAPRDLEDLVICLEEHLHGELNKLPGRQVDFASRNEALDGVLTTFADTFDLPTPTITLKGPNSAAIMVIVHGLEFEAEFSVVLARLVVRTRIIDIHPAGENVEVSSLTSFAAAIDQQLPHIIRRAIQDGDIPEERETLLSKDLRDLSYSYQFNDTALRDGAVFANDQHQQLSDKTWLMFDIFLERKAQTWAELENLVYDELMQDHTDDAIEDPMCIDEEEQNEDQAHTALHRAVSQHDVDTVEPDQESNGHLSQTQIRNIDARVDPSAAVKESDVVVTSAMGDWVLKED